MKWMTGCLAVISTLFLIMIGVLFTHTGNVWLWQQAKKHVPQLQGELTAGRLSEGWTFQGLSWDSPEMSFSSTVLTLHWQLSGLLERQLTITRLDAEQPSLVLHDITPSGNVPPEENAETATGFSLPVAIGIKSLTVDGFSFRQGENTVALQRLVSSLSVNNGGALLNKTTADDLTIQWSSSPSEPAPKNTSVQLPSVVLPLPVTIKDIQLNNVRYNEESVPEIQLAAEAHDDTVIIHSLAVNHAMASATARGQIHLQGNYPLSLSIDAALKPALTGKLPDTQFIAATASGDLRALGLSLSAQGVLNATLSGQVDTLTPQLPFEAKLLWEPIQWPFSSHVPEITLDKGELNVKGRLDHYSVALNSAMTAASQPATAIVLKGEGNTQRLNVGDLRLSTAEGNAEISGLLDWQQAITWKGKVVLAGLNPKFWVPQLPGKLDGTIEHTFSYAQNSWTLALPTLSITGRLRDYPVSLKGSAKGNSRMDWSLDKVSLGVGDNTLTADGRLSDEWNLQAVLEGPALKQIYPGLSGSVKGSLKITGNAHNPTIDYSLNSPFIAWQDIVLSTINSAGTLSKKEEYSGKLNLFVQKIRGPSLSIDQLKLLGQGQESDHAISLSAKGTPLGATLNVKGKWQNQQWAGALNQALLNTPAGLWALQQPVKLSVTSEQVLSLSQQSWVSGRAALNIAPTRIAASQGQTAFTLKGLELETFSAFFPDNFSWKTTLAGEGSLAWENSIPELALKLSTTPGTIKVDALDSEYHTLMLDVSLSQEQLQADLNFQSQQLGQATTKLVVDDVQHQRRLSGDLAVHGFMLNVLTPFVPEVSDIKGILSAEGRFSGTLNSTLFYGDIALHEGDIKTTQDIAHIAKLNTLMRIEGNTGKLSGQMRVGEGTLSLGGFLDWQTLPPKGTLTFQGDDLSVKYPGMGEVRLNPDLTLSLGTGQRLTGRLTIPWARIAIESLPESAVSRSKDVVIISSKKSALTQQNTASPVDIDITLRLGKDVYLDAFGLQTRLQGGVGIAQRPGKPLEMQGTINLKEGRYHSLGQNLVIEEGKIIFSGPPDNPYLSLKAIRNPEAIEDDVTVGILVNSPLQQPEWTLFSDPAMSQTEQFSYLLRGRGLDANSEDSSALQSMLLGLGVSQLGGVVSSIGETIGIEDVMLDTEGSGNDTQVTVSGNLSPDIQVQYGIGVFSSVGEVKVRYQLMPRLYLQAVSGLSQALDVFYRFSL